MSEKKTAHRKIRKTSLTPKLPVYNMEDFIDLSLLFLLLFIKQQSL